MFCYAMPSVRPCEGRRINVDACIWDLDQCQMHTISSCCVFVALNAPLAQVPSLFWHCCFRSAALARSCTVALGPATAHTHSTDTHTRQEVVSKQLSVLKSKASASLRSASAESLGLFAASTSSSLAAASAQSASSAEEARFQILEGMLRVLCTLCPAVLAAVQQLVDTAQTWLNPKCLQGIQAEDGTADTEESSEVVLGVLTGKLGLDSMCCFVESCLLR